MMESPLIKEIGAENTQKARQEAILEFLQARLGAIPDESPGGFARCVLEEAEGADPALPPGRLTLRRFRGSCSRQIGAASKKREPQLVLSTISLSKRAAGSFSFLAAILGAVVGGVFDLLGFLKARP